MKPQETLALNDCDKEPVHIPGRIQPFGAMMGFNLQSGQVHYQSENLGSLLEINESTSLGLGYEDVLARLGDRKLVHEIRGALGLPTIRTQRDRVGVFDLVGKRVDVSVYATADTAVVEFEPDAAVPDRPQSPVSTVRSMMSAVREGDGMMPLLDSSVKALRLLTGHDRVMAYKFFENGDGEVVAEAKGPGIEPFLGLRYPAWDIPTQVRQIMLRAPFRVIKDIRADHVGLLMSPAVQPLDMTFSHLRGVSPIHIEYLENMGVRATMNTSIIVRGKLWGLFAFHHHRPRIATPDQRSICELFGQLSSMMIQQEEERDRLSARQRARSTVSAIEATIADPESPDDDIDFVVDRLSADLMKVVQADGMGIIRSDSTKLIGETTAPEVVSRLAEAATDDVVSIDRLSQVNASIHGSLGKSAGTLMLRLPNDEWLAFFRNEVIHEIRWAGGTDKEITVGPNGPRLTPRGSFAEYKESVAGRCNPWTESDLNSASEICREMWKIVQVTAVEQSKQLQQQKRFQDLLIAELNHRVRNTLALVRSIARQTTASSVSLEQFVEMLEKRITALSTAHDLIGGSGLQWAQIDDLLRVELKPYEFDTSRVLIEGSPIAVRADVAPLVALLFHEMTSNAAKHGALSQQGGCLTVRWHEDSGGVSIQWQEDLGRELSEPDRRGFGWSLIERALPYECGGRSSIRFGGKQLLIDFWLPQESVHRLSEGETASAASLSQSKSKVESEVSLNLQGIESALVVEDNMVLAMELERALLELGVTSVDTMPNADLASSAIETQQYDCAVLDINLGGETSFAIAELLQTNGVAIVLASGYDSKYELPRSLLNVPRLTKPIGRVDLVNAINLARESTG